MPNLSDILRPSVALVLLISLAAIGILAVDASAADVLLFRRST